jgi:hypothetical protein
LNNQTASRKRSVGHYFPRYLAVVLLIVGIITGALDAKFGGFTPIMWFLLALAVLVIITCREVLSIADFLESKK